MNDRMACFQAAGHTGEYIRVASAVRSVGKGELDTLLLWLDDIWASSSEGEGEGVSCTRSWQDVKSQQEQLH